jgi:hypothetical protein
MARRWALAFVCLVGCGDNLAPPPEYDRVVEAADVSILYPLPATLDLMIQPSEEAAYGQLYPEPLLPTLIGPVDIGMSYGDLRLVAVRLDPCSARDGCSAEVRAIFQPIVVGADGQLAAADGAVHVFYGMDPPELLAMLKEILVLKKSYGGGVFYDGTLGLQPILVATGLDGDFATGLHAILLEHLGESRIQRFTEQNHQVPADDRWDFYKFDRVGPDLVRQDIETVMGDEQQLTGTHTDPALAGGVVVVAPPLASSELAVVDANRPAAVTDDIRAGFARAIQLQDPTQETSESIDCVQCHLAEGAHRVGTAEYGLSATGAFQSDRSLDYRRDLRAVTNLHMFAYNGRYVSVTQRVANESAATADAMQAELTGASPLRAWPSRSGSIRGSRGDSASPPAPTP